LSDSAGALTTGDGGINLFLGEVLCLKKGNALLQGGGGDAGVLQELDRRSDQILADGHYYCRHNQRMNDALY